MNTRSLIAIILLLTACGDTDNPADSAAVTVKVMTWNVYIGGDVQTAFTSLDNPLNLPAEVAAFWTAVNASDFPSRARTIASIIAREQPHLVGLQEVSRFLTQSPGDFLAGNPVQAQDVALDFLDELLAALAEQNQSYVVAASVDNSDIEFISITADDIRQIDREVILARSDVAVTNSRSGQYQSRVEVSLIGNAVVEIPRGWVMADVIVEDQGLRFVSTHLEVGRFRDIQVAQAAELVALFPTDTRTVLLGDINSSPSTPAPASYGTILGADYVDSWLALTSEPGETCCHDDDLRNETVSLTGRIDMVFHHGDLTPVASTIVGDEIADRTPSGLWPSDHAGVVTTFSIP